jgi:hypothetical protein
MTEWTYAVLIQHNNIGTDDAAAAAAAAAASDAASDTAAAAVASDAAAVSKVPIGGQIRSSSCYSKRRMKHVAETVHHKLLSFTIES